MISGVSADTSSIAPNNHLDLERMQILHRHHDVAMYDDLLTHTVHLPLSSSFKSILDSYFYATTIASSLYQDPGIQATARMHMIEYGNIYTSYPMSELMHLCDEGELTVREIEMRDMSNVNAAFMARLLKTFMSDRKRECMIPGTFYNVPHLFFSYFEYHRNSTNRDICLLMFHNFLHNESVSTLPIDADFSPYYVFHNILPFDDVHCSGLTTRTKRSPKPDQPFHWLELNNNTIPIFRKIYHTTHDRVRKKRIRDVFEYEGISLYIRDRRWDASAVCGWPLVSTSAKVLGGECAVSPQIDDIKNVLSTTRAIVDKESVALDSLYRGLLLSESSIRSIYGDLTLLTSSVDILNERMHFVEFKIYWLRLQQQIHAYNLNFASLLAKINTARLSDLHGAKHHSDVLLNFDALLSAYGASLSSVSTPYIIVADVEFGSVVGGVSDVYISIAVPIMYDLHGVYSDIAFTAYTYPICYNGTYYHYPNANKELLCNTVYSCIQYPTSLCHSVSVGAILCPTAVPFAYEQYHTTVVADALYSKCMSVYLIPPRTLYISSNITLHVTACDKSTTTAYNVVAPLVMDMICGYEYIYGSGSSERFVSNCHCADLSSYIYDVVDGSVVPRQYTANASELSGIWDYVLPYHLQSASGSVKSHADVTSFNATWHDTFERLQRETHVLSHVMDSQIHALHGTIDGSGYILLAIIGVATLIILLIMCRATPQYHYLSILALFLPLALGAPSNVITEGAIDGNCTVAAAKSACINRQYDSCHHIESVDYCFCKSSGMYARHDGVVHCKQHHFLYQYLLDFFRCFYEPQYIAILLLVVILYLVWHIYASLRRKEGRPIIPFRKSK